MPWPLGRLTSASKAVLLLRLRACRRRGALLGTIRSAFLQVSAEFCIWELLPDPGTKPAGIKTAVQSVDVSCWEGFAACALPWLTPGSCASRRRSSFSCSNLATSASSLCSSSVETLLSETWLGVGGTRPGMGPWRPPCFGCVAPQLALDQSMRLAGLGEGFKHVPFSDPSISTVQTNHMFKPVKRDALNILGPY